MRLTDLTAAVARSGLQVIPCPGWQGRGGELDRVAGIVLHHTAGAARGDYPSLAVVRDGRPDLPGPLSQLGLGRSGAVYVIAAGRANHAGAGAWPGITGNADTIGIEAESVGDGTWTDAQRDAYPRLVRALARYYSVPTPRVIAHREWAPTRKIDPAGIDMRALRAFVDEEDDMFNEADRQGLVRLTQMVEGYGRRVEQMQVQLDDVAAKQVGYGGRIERVQGLVEWVAPLIVETRDRVMGVLPATLDALLARLRG